MNKVNKTGMHPWLRPMFCDPQKWLGDLETALAGEAGAIQFYGYLESIAPSNEARKQVDFARKDEIKHHRMFTQLYERLTGHCPPVVNPVVTRPTFADGVYMAFNDELDAAELYKGMLLSVHNLAIRDMMFEIMTDEMEHASRFSMIMAAGMAGKPAVS